jgi:hypothetical protein
LDSVAGQHTRHAALYVDGLDLGMHRQLLDPSGLTRRPQPRGRRDR